MHTLERTVKRFDACLYQAVLVFRLWIWDRKASGRVNNKTRGIYLNTSPVSLHAE